MNWEMSLRNERYKGFEEGKAEGIETGVMKERISMLIRKAQKGRTLEEAAAEMDYDPEELRPLWVAVTAAAPDYSVEKILQMISR